jgi:hypothetical protein
MHIYIFRSDANSELRAFAGDAAGSKLPEQFGPWHADGVVGPGKSPPHKLPRAVIETAVATQGFQLWRTKPKAGGATA